MKSLKYLIFALLLSPAAHALVDMRNANFSDNWIDLQVKNSGYDLRVQRSYNSRTLFNGMFGFGWCSDFETKLQVTTENTVKVTECGAGFEAEYKKQNGEAKSVESTVKAIMAEVRKRNKTRDENYFKNLEIEILRDSMLREEFTSQLKMTGEVADGVKYYADGRVNDAITFKGGEYIRNLPNGTYQRFDKQGRLLQMNDRNSNFIKFVYDGAKLTGVQDNAGSMLNFKYVPNSKYVKTVSGPSGLKSEYEYKGETLSNVKTAWNNAYKYQYDELYNLTKVDYPDKTTVALTYDKDKDWVTSFRDRRGCTETYTYTDSEKNAADNYRSEVVKKCEDKITNRSSYEFWHKKRKDGSHYLARTKSVRNNEVTETEYHEMYGRPTLVSQNNIVTRFDYYPNGLLKTRTEPNRNLSYKYDNTCQKVSQVSVKLSIPSITMANGKGKNRKPSTAKADSKTITTDFLYNDKNCNLVSAKNTDGQTVALTYDMRGRITKILDQSKKEVTISYEERFGKPLVVTRPGLGTIKFKYKNTGEVEKIDSADEPLVAVQVANIFSNLLEVIAPATTDTTI